MTFRLMTNKHGFPCTIVTFHTFLLAAIHSCHCAMALPKAYAFVLSASMKVSLVFIAKYQHVQQ